MKKLHNEIKFLVTATVVFIALNIIDIIYNAIIMDHDSGESGYLQQMFPCRSLFRSTYSCNFADYLSNGLLFKFLIGIPLSILITAIIFLIITKIPKKQ